MSPDFVMLLSPPVLILGMHRSGTSCLTGSLEEAGLYLGAVNTAAGFNKKGNRENRAIMEYHDGILARVGASWDNPPAVDPEWTQAEKQELQRLLASYEGIPIWGLKDPRLLFMLKGWQAITRPTYIGTFRHPVEVASSLVHRAEVWGQPMRKEQAYGLWAAYNEKMLSVYRKQPFRIIRFDIEPSLYNQKLEYILDDIGLDTKGHNTFRENELHNQRKQQEAVPQELQGIWEALNDYAI